MMELAFLPGIGPMEIAVIAVIALLVLGPSRLPEAARSLGKGMKEMRDSFSGAMDDDDDDDLALDEADEEDFDDSLYAPEDGIDEDAEPGGDETETETETETEPLTSQPEPAPAGKVSESA
jgi:sec-independent protein translocase protein TatA